MTTSINKSLSMSDHSIDSVTAVALGTFGIAVLGVFGKVFSGIANWLTGRDTRFKEWEKWLDAREREYTNRIELEITELQTEVASLKTANELLSRRITALKAYSRQIMERAFPLDHDIPEDLRDLALRIDRGDI